MTTARKLLPAGALALALAFSPVQAAPVASSIAAAAKSGAGGLATPVHRRGWGAAPWIGLGAGVVIGSIIASEAYRPRPGYYYDDDDYDGPYYYPSGYAGDPRAICAQNFRSFEWSTGLYTTYSGEKRLCPYLR
jgi:hypothetical protein